MQNWIEPQSAALDRQSYVERNFWRHQRNHFRLSFRGNNVADVLPGQARRVARRYFQSFCHRIRNWECATLAGWLGWAIGLLFGLLLSFPAAIITKA
jgi:hypothetical protein